MLFPLGELYSLMELLHPDSGHVVAYKELLLGELVACADEKVGFELDFDNSDRNDYPTTQGH